MGRGKDLPQGGLVKQGPFVLNETVAEYLNLENRRIIIDT
jgi:hypothetical protein